MCSLWFIANAQVNLTQGLTGVYYFNNSANDSTSFTQNGALINGAGFADSRFAGCNQSAFFDNPGEAVNLPRNIIHGNTEFSVTGWIKINQYPATILSASNNTTNKEILWQINNQGQFRTTLKNALMSGNETFPLNQWVHVALTRSANGIVRTYINGNQTNQTGLAQGVIDIEISALNLGVEQNCVAGCFDPITSLSGYMDDFRFYNRVISTFEVNAILTLPNFYQNANMILVSVDTVIVCSMPAGIQANSGYTNYQWNTGANSAVANVNNPGWYYVSAFNGCATVFDSAFVYLNIPPTVQIINGDSAVLCSTDTIRAAITNNSIADFYWSNNTQGKRTFAQQNGWLYVNAVNACGNARDSIYVTLKPLPIVNLGADIFLCPGDNIQIGIPSQPATTYLWNTNAQTSFITVNQQGIYILAGQNECGIVVDSIQISQPIKPFLGNDTLLCAGDTIQFSIPNNFDSYLWNGNAGNFEFNATSGGTLMVEAFTGNCSTGDTIEITFIDLPEIFNVDSIVTIACTDTIVLLAVPTVYDSLMWFDSSVSFFRTVVNSGNYSLEAYLSGCAVSDKIFVEINEIQALDQLKNIDSVYCQPGRYVIDIQLADYHQVIWANGGNENYRVLDVPFADSVRIESPCDTAFYRFKSEITECTCTHMFIPNAISANNDLMNESFKVETDCLIREFKVEIFNRYGALVFTSNNKDFVFNNESCGNCLQTNSLYVYLIQYEALIDSRWKVIDKKGHFTNIR